MRHPTAVTTGIRMTPGGHHLMGSMKIFKNSKRSVAPFENSHILKIHPLISIDSLITQFSRPVLLPVLFPVGNFYPIRSPPHPHTRPQRLVSWPPLWASARRPPSRSCHFGAALPAAEDRGNTHPDGEVSPKTPKGKLMEIG